MIPYESRNFVGLLARRKARRHAESVLADMGLTDIDPTAVVSDLDLALRQKIEITRTVSRKPKILLLDEPTSALTGEDMEWLGGIIQRLKDEGTTIIYISHRMLEIRDYCDCLTILRNGEAVHEGSVGDVSDEEIVRLIIGRSLSETFPERRDTSVAGAPALAAKDLSVGNRLKNTSFELQKSEVLGVAGLQGMGQLELFKACFGVNLPSQGTLLVDGKEITLASPANAIKAGIDIGFIPEDRKTEGLFLPLSCSFNVSLPVIGDYARFGIINSVAETSAVSSALEKMQVDKDSFEMNATQFSGGNQQKMVIARWLVAGSRILLLYDPTRGVDIGTKSEIYKLIRSVVAEGGAVLFYSTEIEEVINISDRVIIFYNGRISRTFEHYEITEEAIMKTALGHTQQTKAA